MEAWKRVWRTGLAPLLSDEALGALAAALRDDDPRLMQGATTTTPPPMRCVQDWPVEAACALAYCGVVECDGFGEATVAEAEEFFGRTCYSIDERMGEPASCRHFLNWFDDTPREEMRRLLLVEVESEIARRTTEEVAHVAHA